MNEISSSYIVRNCLLFAFRALRNTDRHIKDSLQSPYENFFDDLTKALGQGKKLEYFIPNSEVEGFYTKNMTENDFVTSVQNKLLSKIPHFGPGTVVSTGSNPGTCNGGMSTVVSAFNHLSLLFTVVWDLLSKQNLALCNRLPKLSGRQLWEIFLKLDTESEIKVHVDDIADLILRIFRANGHNEREENIKEWFCGEEKVDFWGFFSQIVENFVGLLQIHIVQEVHQEVVSEFLKEGRLEKKGHRVHNWKSRWFVLTATALTYYESHDSMILKGSVVINSNSLVQNMPEFRARPHRFRVVCGETKTGTEISAPDINSLQDWIYTIRMAIKMHTSEGRNFLHKYRMAVANLPSSSNKGKILPHSASMEKVKVNPTQQSSHRVLASSKSVPLDVSSSREGKEKKPKTSDTTRPDIGAIKEGNGVGFEDSSEYGSPPPVPPQRFDSGDTKGLNSNKNFEIFDKKAFVEARRNSRATRKNELRRHSSINVDHIGFEGEEYAVINRGEKGKKKKAVEVESLLSDSVKAQLSIESTKQIESWDAEDEKEGKHNRENPGYVRLHFHTEDITAKPKSKVVSDAPKVRDFERTKFGYSTVVFESEKKYSDKERAERMRQNKPVPPLPPPKYEGSGPSLPPKKLVSDSDILYAGINHSLPSRVDKATSSPDLKQSELGDSEGEFENDPPYVNVGPNRAPIVPPRRGVAAIPEESPPLPMHKTS